MFITRISLLSKVTFISFLGLGWRHPKNSTISLFIIAFHSDLRKYVYITFIYIFIVYMCKYSSICCIFWKSEQIWRSRISSSKTTSVSAMSLHCSWLQLRISLQIRCAFDSERRGHGSGRLWKIGFHETRVSPQRPCSSDISNALLETSLKLSVDEYWKLLEMDMFFGARFV